MADRDHSQRSQLKRNSKLGFYFFLVEAAHLMRNQPKRIRLHAEIFARRADIMLRPAIRLLIFGKGWIGQRK